MLGPGDEYQGVDVGQVPASNKRVQYLQARPLEIACVTRNKSEVELKCRGSDHAVQ
jgi:hypothetical protein